MNITRDVILDLLPAYLSGDASADTRALVEEFLARDTELAEKIRAGALEGMATPPLDLPPGIEVRALRRTKRVLAWQRWLLGFAIFFTSMALSFSFEAQGWHVTNARLFLLERAPGEWAACVAGAAVCWAAYLMTRRRLRAAL